MKDENNNELVVSNRNRNRHFLGVEINILKLAVY